MTLAFLQIWKMWFFAFPTFNDPFTQRGWRVVFGAPGEGGPCLKVGDA